MEEIVKLICETNEFKEYYKFVTKPSSIGPAGNKFHDCAKEGLDVIGIVLNTAEFKNEDEKLEVVIQNFITKDERGYEYSGEAMYIANIFKENDNLVLNGETYNSYYGYEDYGNGFGPQGYQKFSEPKIENIKRFSYSYENKADLFPSSGSFSM